MKKTCHHIETVWGYLTSDLIRLPCAYQATDRQTGRTGLLENTHDPAGDTKPSRSAFLLQEIPCRAPCRLQWGTHLNCTLGCYNFAPCSFPFWDPCWRFNCSHWSKFVSNRAKLWDTDLLPWDPGISPDPSQLIIMYIPWLLNEVLSAIP